MKDLIIGFLKTSKNFDPNELYLSIKGLDIDELRLSEIIATRPSRHLYQVKKRYPILYKNILDDDIKGDTSNYVLINKFLNILLIIERY